ncbi:MAG: extracellular solute-binding protein [Waterburya sp.]
MGRKFSDRFQSKYLQIIPTITQLTVGITILFIFIACFNSTQLEPQSQNQPKSPTTELNIWWEQGMNHDEDLALRTIVDHWQKQTGNKIKLSFFSNSEFTAKVERAVQAKNYPDIILNPRAEKVLYPRLAWQGKLEDVSEIIKPIQDDYPKDILEEITYYNAEENKRSYYGVPVYQATLFIYYWQTLLTSVGLNPKDISQDWDGFWQFWQQAQQKLRTKQHPNIFGLGLTLSANESTSDTHNLFEQILEAYDVVLFNEQGQLKIDRPEVRQRIINCLNWYAQLYRQGYIPPDAVKWSNDDNNRNLLNQLLLMTPNASLSIPATVRQDSNTYYNKLGMTEFPNKPSGKPMRYFSFVTQAVIFQDSPHKSLAKSFLRYFIQPEVTIDYLKDSGSRNQPVQRSVWSDPYWQNTKDPYIATATKILTTGQTRLSHVVVHPAYSQVLAENVWGRALTQVTANKIQPEKAADEAIARIHEIFTQWSSSTLISN